MRKGVILLLVGIVLVVAVFLMVVSGSDWISPIFLVPGVILAYLGVERIYDERKARMRVPEK